MTMRRALFFVETPHRLAGAQRSLLAMLAAIRTHGIDPLVVLPAAGPVADAYRAEGLDVRIERANERLLVFERGVHALPARDKAALVLRDVVPYSARLARLAIREGVSVVHFNQLRGLFVAGMLLPATGIPIALHLHGMPNFGAPHLFDLGALVADRVIVCADAIVPTLGASARRKCVTIHNGLRAIPSFDRDESRRKLTQAIGIPESDRDTTPIVVTLSTRTAFKGLHHLVDAVAAIRASSRPIAWAMLGPGGESSYVRFLERKIHDAGLDHGTVATLGYRDDAIELLAGADLLVLPTIERETIDDGTGPRTVVLTEGLPMAILEALAVGIPTVASDVAGVREELTDGVTGCIVPPGEVRALADAITRVLDDASLRERVRSLGPEVVRTRFSSERATEALARTLHAIAR